MSVEFQEEPSAFNPNLYNKPTSKISAWLITKGFAKDETSANKLQVIMSVIFLLVSFYLFFS
jgi:hypothetical protein